MHTRKFVMIVYSLMCCAFVRSYMRIFSLSVSTKEMLDSIYQVLLTEMYTFFYKRNACMHDLSLINLYW